MQEGGENRRSEKKSMLCTGWIQILKEGAPSILQTGLFSVGDMTDLPHPPPSERSILQPIYGGGGAGGLEYCFVCFGLVLLFYRRPIVLGSSLFNKIKLKTHQKAGTCKLRLFGVIKIKWSYVTFKII